MTECHENHILIKNIIWCRITTTKIGKGEISLQTQEKCCVKMRMIVLMISGLQENYPAGADLG